jgi:ABC-type nitrate/sulfonate/bicarbonate transport system substrate-binding protein
LQISAGRFVLFLVALSVNSAPAAAQNRTKLVIGYSAMQASVAPLWIAEERGFFAKYGIEPQLVFVRTTSVHMAGLLSGHIDLSYGGGSGILPLAGSGVDLRFIASFGSRLTHFLVTRPEVQKPRDLQNKRIGVVSIGGTQWITTKLGLEYLGIDEQRDGIRILAIGDQSILRGALEGGNIDGAFFNGAMAEELRSKGFRFLTDLYTANIQTLSSGVIVKKTSLQKNRETMTRMLQAVIEGLAFVKSPSRKAMVVKTLMERLKINDMGVAEQGYQYLQRDLDTTFYPTVEGLQNLQRFMRAYNPRVAGVNAADLVDDSVVKQLYDMRFIEKLFASYGIEWAGK